MERQYICDKCEQIVYPEPKPAEELEHLPRAGRRFSTEESTFSGFCPRCLMTEEEALQNPCYRHAWLKEELSRQRESMIKEERKRILRELLIREAEKWENAKHCTCLGHAIVSVFGLPDHEYSKAIKDLKRELLK